MGISIDEQLSRMKGLMTYGQVNEDKSHSNYTMEYHTIGPDGKSYGIIKECNKYYIKSADKDKETIAEAYNYIGGYMNKKAFEYTSYANALKNFELKMASLNEAFNGKVNIETLDPFKKEEFIVEATDKMRDEIARQRQIMYNVGVLMNENAGIGQTPFKSQPEAEHANSGDKDTPFTDKAEARLDVDPKFNAEKPEKQGVPFTGEKKAEEGKEVKVEGSVASEDPKGGKVVRVNEGCECGECDLAAGVPCEAGVGEADSDHNNEPFNKGIEEGCCKEEEEKLPEAPEEVNGWNQLNEEGEEELDIEEEPEEGEDDFSEEDFEIDGDEDGEEGEEEDFDVDSLEDEPEELGDEEGEEEEIDFEDEDEPEFEEGEEVDETDPDSIRAEIERLQGILDGIEAPEEVEGEPVEEPEADIPAEEPEIDADTIEAPEEVEGEPVEAPEEEMPAEEEPELDELMEQKTKFMESIIDSVVKDILAEEKTVLHDFGKHPGYRKKPMSLPATGEDQNAHGKDWNDKSVDSEEPFGQKIGKGDPFNVLVDAVTKDVMNALKESKKKVK